MRRSLSRGFTLIELLIVVVVIAVLALIAIPAYQQFVVRAERADAKSALQEVTLRQERFRANNPTYSANFTGLGLTPDAGGKWLSEEGKWQLTLTLSASPELQYTVTVDKVSGLPDGQCDPFTGVVTQGQLEVSPANCWAR